MQKMGIPLRKADKHYTYKDYRHWPDDERWELIDGAAWNMSPAPNRFHQGISFWLSTTIGNHLKGKPCEAYAAPFDVLLPALGEEDEDDVSTVVQPDISVICDKSKLTPKGCTGAPDWIIEIISPYTSSKDFSIKHSLYERHGVKEYWLIDPGNRFVNVLLLSDDGKYPEEPFVYEEDAVISSNVLERLVVDLEELFGVLD